MLVVLFTYELKKKISCRHLREIKARVNQRTQGLFSTGGFDFMDLNHHDLPKFFPNKTEQKSRASHCQMLAQNCFRLQTKFHQPSLRTPLPPFLFNHSHHFTSSIRQALCKALYVYYSIFIILPLYSEYYYGHFTDEAKRGKISDS